MVTSVLWDCLRALVFIVEQHTSRESTSESLIHVKAAANLERLAGNLRGLAIQYDILRALEKVTLADATTTQSLANAITQSLAGATTQSLADAKATMSPAINGASVLSAKIDALFETTFEDHRHPLLSGLTLGKESVGHQLGLQVLHEVKQSRNEMKI